MVYSRTRRRLQDRKVTYPSAIEFGVGVARAFAGALVFSLPMLMTMEMWWLGFHMDPFRLALLFGLMLPLLVRLSKYGGLRRTASLWDDLADGLVVIAVSFAAAFLILWIFGVVNDAMPMREILGKVAVQTFPASIGGMLARNQFKSQEAERQEEEAEASYAGELFLMVVGALFLLLNLSPTEEIILLAYQMNAWQEIMLLMLSIMVMHAFVYNVELRGSHPPRPGETFWSLFARFTIVGYALVLVVSVYVLWTFGRTDGTAMEEILSAAIVLSFPGAIGAAAARVIL